MIFYQWLFRLPLIFWCNVVLVTIFSMGTGSTTLQAAPIQRNFTHYQFSILPQVLLADSRMFPNIVALWNPVGLTSPDWRFSPIFGFADSTVQDSVPKVDTATAVKTPVWREPLSIPLRQLRDSLGINARVTSGAGAHLREAGEVSRFLSQGYSFSAGLDSQRSTNNRVLMRLRESLYQRDFLEPQSLTLENYLTQRREYLHEKIKDSTLRHYDIKRTSKFELSNILEQAGLNIPIPQNPLSTLFGKAEVKLNVNLEINVRAGWRWDTQNLGVISAFGQTQSSPMFSQDIQANYFVDVGDKLKIALDQNTKRQFDFDNLTNIKFEGDADDIFKRVELGNVQLNTPSTFINGSQALFGARADFQFGPVFLKTIASQKRGLRKSVTIKGGSVKQPIYLRAYDYAENNFVVDTLYKDIIRRAYSASPPGTLQGADIRNNIKYLEVWESTNDLRDIIVAKGIAFADLSKKPAGGYPQKMIDTATIQAGLVEKGRFKRLESSKYTVDQFGRITILQLRRDRTYAVAYRVEGASPLPTDDEDFGDLSSNDKAPEQTSLLDSSRTYVFKLLYRPNLQPGFKSLWNRQLRNVYSIGASNVDLTSTKIEFWYFRASNDSSDVLPGAADKLPTVLGIDLVNNSTGATPPDGVFDMGVAGAAGTAFFNASRGEIIFPSLEPFRDGLRQYFTKIGKSQEADKFVYAAVYDTTREVAKIQTERDRFVITGEVSGAASNRLSLPNAFNLSPGSVQVRLDGVALAENADYTVEYFTGQVTLLNPRATLPNANLEVEYEQNDVFNTATRTLLGMRVDLDMHAILRSRTIKSTLGMTLMSFDQALTIDRVRPGEEPVSNTMMGIDGSLSMEMPWLTRALDFLPIFNTKAPSSLSIKGEVAAILPGPNKRYSNITSDNGEPVAFIDDFEGGLRPISLNTIPSLWTHASPPRDASMGFGNLGLQHDDSSSMYRGNLYWFRYGDPREPVENVYPNRCVSYLNKNMQVMEVRFNPDIRGIYNQNPDFKDSITYSFTNGLRRDQFVLDSAAGKLFFQQPKNKEKIWGGFMRLLSSFNTNFDNDNIEYLEVVMRVNEKEDGTKMFIDLGQINEDVIPNNELNTEDGFTTANPVPNGIIGPNEEGEDVGLDLMNNDEEKGTSTDSSKVVATFRNIWQKGRYRGDLSNEPDPARDDFAFDFSIPSVGQTEADFLKFNGLENNRNAQAGSFPDTEVLNRNNGQTLSQDNSFFRYEVLLNDNPGANAQIVNKTQAGWVTIRIPLRSEQYRQNIGQPLFSNIQYVRVWWKGGKFKGQIADWYLVGSQWQRFRPLKPDQTTDTTHTVAYVGIENNSGAPEYYTLPPGVERPQQIGNPDPNQNCQLNEQSMVLKVNNMPIGEERMAIRIFRPFDIFFYKQLKFFLHGAGEGLTYTVPANQVDVQAFIRFGLDSLNYYEYRVPYLAGWQDININLQELTGIKSGRDSASIASGAITTQMASDGIGQFAIKGSPVLTRIQFIGFGLRNAGNAGGNVKTLSTAMWADELRIISPDTKIDFAAVGSITARLADIASISGNINHTGPGFRRLEERFGNRISRTNWNVTAQTSIEKMLPDFMGNSTLPFSYSHTETAEQPDFAPQSDVNVATVVQREGRPNDPNNQAELLRAAARADSVRRSTQTVIVEDQFALTGARLSIPLPGLLNVISEHLLNRFSFSFDYAQRYERSPVVEERFRWAWKTSLSYSHGFQIPPVKPFGWTENIPILSALKDYTLYPLPSAFAVSLDLQRSRVTEKSRFLEDPSPVVRNFTADRKFRFTWKMSENGLINPTVEYSVQTLSTLSPLETINESTFRTGGEIFKEMWWTKNSLLYLGDDVRHDQNVSIAMRPQLPAFLGGKFISMTGNFSTMYSWQNILNMDNPDLGKGAGTNTSFRLTMNINPKDLGNAIFGTSAPVPMPAGTATPAESPENKGFLGTLGSLGKGFLSAIKAVFFDYERVSLNLTQQGSALSPGVRGGTGIGNFWGRAPFRAFGLQETPGLGPNILYQLGLITNPHGGGPPSTFPFYDFDANKNDAIGSERAANALMQDNYRQKIGIDLRVNRVLWEGAQLELNWKSDFEGNRNQTLQTGSDGRVNDIRNRILTQTYNRSIISFPFWGINSLEKVKKEYTDRTNETALIESGINLKDTLRVTQYKLEKISEAFRDGMEAFVWVKDSKLRQLLPRVNWAFRWDGMEKLPFWRDIVRRATLEHAYKGNYQSTERTSEGITFREGEQVEASFQPLIGLSIQFDDRVMGGPMSGSLRYNIRNSFRIGGATPTTVAQESSNEINLNWTYGRRGFKLPEFLGITLENDIEFAFLAIYRRSVSSTADLLQAPDKSYTLDGKTSIQIEPSARYTISKQLTARAFFRYEANLTEGAAAPGSSTTQFGVDLRISLSGGRGFGF